MQQTLIVGDTLAFTTTLPDYPASDGWTLTYRLVPRTSGTQYELTASADGDAYDVAVSATTTALWTAGEYSWSSYVTKAAERYTVESGTITLLPDPGQVAAYDGRSQARKAVDDLRAALATYTASQGHVAEYEIAGRRMKFKDSTDILTLLNYWEIALQREEAAAAVAAGRPNPRRYYLRFGRA